jgi:uncharacterized protein (DUF934 family)
MPLLRGDELVEDRWLRLPDDAPLPADGAILLGHARLTAEAEYLWHRPDGLGLELQPGDPLDLLDEWLPHLELVALRFPSFTDGRPFSTARILREQHGYRGELRATGKPIPDQHQFLLQCGFDTIEIAPDDLPRWRDAHVWMPLTYQVGYGETAGRHALSVFRARHARRHEAAAA